jgi:hypothetical protein
MMVNAPVLTGDDLPGPPRRYLAHNTHRMCPIAPRGLAALDRGLAPPTYFSGSAEALLRKSEVAFGPDRVQNPLNIPQRQQMA